MRVLKEEGPRRVAGFKPRRYEVHYKWHQDRDWVLWSTNATKIGARIDYALAPLGYAARRIVDNGKNWLSDLVDREEGV